MTTIRPETTGRKDIGIGHNGGPPLNAVERRRKISVKEAAELNDISEDSFRRHYGHLIKQITPARVAVELGDALDIGQSKAAPP
jgi:hypothetical protein